jgi:hypothetical protein
MMGVFRGMIHDGLSVDEALAGVGNEADCPANGRSERLRAMRPLLRGLRFAAGASYSPSTPPLLGICARAATPS